MAGQVITQIAADSGTHLISNSFYGTCNTAENTTTKEVIINNTNINSITLVKGMLLSIFFTYGCNYLNSEDTISIEIYTNNGTTGSPSKGTKLVNALNAYGEGTAPPFWSAQSIVLFIYDGSVWVKNDSFSANGGAINGNTEINANLAVKGNLSATQDVTLNNGLTTLEKIYCKSTDIDTTTSASTDIYDGAIDFIDDNGIQLGNITSVHQPNGYYGISIGIYNNTLNIGNGINFLLNDQGNRNIWVHDPSIWRSALGIGTIGTKDTLSASDIPSLTGSYLPRTGGALTGDLEVSASVGFHGKWKWELQDNNNLSLIWTG